MKRNLLFIALLCSLTVFGQEKIPNSSTNYDEIIANYNQLSLKQLYDTANFYYNNSKNLEKVFMYCDLIIKTPV
jgi:hypothetical protein